MSSKNTTFSKNDILNDLENIINRIDDYDWDYRLNRFEEKINAEKEVVSSVLREIKTSDK